MTDLAIDSRVFAANARKTPSFGNNVAGSLNQGDPVKQIGPQVGDRWVPCEAQIGGAMQNVFISKKVLRDRVSEPRERLIRACMVEWLRFDRETGKETVAPYHDFVGEYWDSIGIDLDGRDDVPWSAAFISFCVRQAGGYDDFKFAAAHARYTHQAIDRRENGTDGSFWGFRPNEHKPQLGDMVCRWRGKRKITYDIAKKENKFPSHNDIVVRVEKTRVVTIGGNVSNTVRRTSYALNNKGFLDGSKKVYAVMRNNL